jgi:hypothetical protein
MAFYYLQKEIGGGALLLLPLEEMPGKISVKGIERKGVLDKLLLIEYPKRTAWGYSY